jgi:eukaryotic-like serine/threonine-protein kinase
LSVQTLASGRYRLETVLGRGGMATVYLAQDEELDRPVALKVLAGHLADGPSFRDRFVREARLAAQLSHPNIVQIFDAGEDGAAVVLVTHDPRVAAYARRDVIVRDGKIVSPVVAA